MRIQGCRSQGIDQGNQSIEQYLVSSDCIYTIEKNQRRGGKMGVDTTRYLQIHFALSKPIKPTWVETYQVMMDPAAVYPHVLETSCHTEITQPAHTGSSPSSRPAWSHTVQEASSDQSLLQSGRRARAKACRTRANTERHGQSPLQYKSSKSSLRAVSFQEFPQMRTSCYSTALRAPPRDAGFTKPFKTKKRGGCRDLKEKEPKRLHTDPIPTPLGRQRAVQELGTVSPRASPAPHGFILLLKMPEQGHHQLFRPEVLTPISKQAGKRRGPPRLSLLRDPIVYAQRALPPRSPASICDSLRAFLCF
ncbi:hypothetical protein Anapl_00004 [Anas platyrhynchos]|uniref:Uncharacterized protein n=1 Tax=Anas platyrhynchos TaxID=8839 RepID=R0K1G7_ANAPL|nr:hypothetical protein Anapl_00004 [Anas platyrhynchos]